MISRMSAGMLGHGWHSHAYSLPRTNHAAPPVVARSSLPGSRGGDAAHVVEGGHEVSLFRATDRTTERSHRRMPARFATVEA